MSTVLHRLRFPDSEVPRALSPCTVKLIGVGFVDVDQAEIVQTSVLKTDATGLLTMDLTPNSEIDPANSYYQLTAGGETWAFIVPEPSDPPDDLWLKNLLTVDPQPGPAPVIGAQGPQGIQGPPGDQYAFTGAQSGSVGIDPTTVMVSSGTTGERFAGYPGGVKCPNGSLLCCHRFGSSTSPTPPGTIVGQRSYDLGKTWGDPFDVFADPGGLDCRSSYLTPLSDGVTIAMTVTAGETGSASRCYVLLSTDSGNTWSDPYPYNTGLAVKDAEANPVCELKDGTLLAPFYGPLACGVVKSTDGGVTWGDPIIVGTWNEPAVIQLQDESLLMVMRDAPNLVYRFSRSYDNGGTWTDPTGTLLYPTMADGAPAIYQMDSGAIVLSFRLFTWPTYPKGEAVQQIVTSRDNCATWSDPITLPAPAVGQTTSGAYSQFFEVAPNLLGYVWSMQVNGTTTSSAYFTYIFDGEGTTPLGHVAGSTVGASFTGTTGRYVGQTDGAPTFGYYNVGDFSTDPTNSCVWICTTAGDPVTPGAFMSTGAANAAAIVAAQAAAIAAAATDATTKADAVAAASDKARWFSSRGLAAPPDLVVQGTWATGVQAAVGSLRNVNTSATQGDGAAWLIDLSAGTWTMTLIGGTSTAGAIVTVDISSDDGATWTAAGTIDLYASGTATFRVAPITGIVVSAPGPYLVRYRALTNNGSSTGWTMILCSMEWTRMA